MFFISLQKLFSFSWKSNFRILDIQVSWHHQMPKHKIRNIFYWITLKVNPVCEWNLASMPYYKRKKIIKTFYKNCNLKTSSRLFCVCKEFKVASVTFLLVCFLRLKESTYETRKNVFYSILKVLSVLEIIRISLFRYSNVMTSSNA